MRKKTIVLTGLAALLALGSTAEPSSAKICKNTTWNKILSSGKITIGSKADYKPWGFLDSSGKLVGMEVDMAQDVAEALGVKLELVPTKGANRIPFLETGKIDMILATMSDTADRRKVSGATLPNYYTSGTNIMAPKALGLKKWEDLRGKPVCGKQGAFYNKKVQSAYGAKIIAFGGAAEGKQALRDKKCVGFLSDDSSIMSDLTSGKWESFEMPLPTEDDTPWVIAVPKDEQDCAFGRFMSGMQYNWLESGRLIELEAKWGIQASAFLKDQKARMKDWMKK